VRREIARIALTKIDSGWAHSPDRIEKLVEDAEAKSERVIKEEGERAAIEAGVPGCTRNLEVAGPFEVPPSYGQNQHHHAIETSRLPPFLAAELGAMSKVAKTAGLLHDIGKPLITNLKHAHQPGRGVHQTLWA